MIEKHWCVHAVYVREAVNNYVYFLGVRIRCGENRVTMHNISSVQSSKYNLRFLKSRELRKVKEIQLVPYDPIVSSTI